MPHNVLISKIRCGNPNKKSTAIHNKNNFEYIGTREGTDLTPLEDENTEKFEKEMSKPEDYLRYIGKRSHSHGLFGNIPLNDIDKLGKEIYKLSRQKRLFYRGIVSLDPRDAEELGYYNKAKWETYIRSIIPDVAKEFGISVQNLKWTAAYHAEAKHPHAHYMFWSSKPMIYDYFITKEKQNSCRQILSGKMFEEERHREVINKEAAKNYILDFGKKLLPNEIEKISAITPGIIQGKTVIPKLSQIQLNQTTEELMRLIPMLPKTGSLSKNAFMSPDVKEQINKVVDSILRNKTVFQEYQKYMSSVDKMSKTYSPSNIELGREIWADNAEKDLRVKLNNIILKNIKGLVKTHSDFSVYVDILMEQSQKQLIPQLTEVVDPSLSDDTEPLDIFYFETINNDTLAFDKSENNQPEPINKQGIYFQPENNDVLEISDPQNYSFENSFSQHDDIEKYFIDWDKTYKSALNELYNTHNYEKAIDQLNSSAAKGNVLAIHDLAKVIQRGLGCIVNEQLATDYYEKAFQGFNQVYNTIDNAYLKEYAAYRIGKLYNTGNGVEKDINSAEKWFKSAHNNKYAQYSLAKIYMAKDTQIGKAIHADRIMELLQSSSEKTPYASYELGNIYRKVFFTDPDSEKSYHHYNVAIEKFNKMLKTVSDDALMYRVGKMYELGLGTEINLTKAIKLYQEAGELKNTYALFSLAKIYLKSDDPALHEKSIQILNDLHKEKPNDDMISYSLGKVYLDEKIHFYNVKKAKEYLEKSASSGNQFAQYQLGKIYSSSAYGETDYSLAISYLKASAAQGNDFAMYQLGVLYKNSDLKFFDIGKAIEYFKSSADLKNQFAQYQLGKIYSSPDFGESNYPLAISYLEASAAQGNDFAMYQLGKIYSNKELPLYDMDKSIWYFLKASNFNNSFAQLQLGVIYLWGKGVKKDSDLGKQFLFQAINNGNEFAQQILDSYETYRLQYVMNVSYKLFNNLFDAILNQNDKASTLAADRYFRNLSKKAMIEEQLKNPHKHNHEPDK